MQLIIAIMLTVIYVGLTLLLGGVPPRNGFPMWFFGPAGMTVVGGIITKSVSAFLPIPWEKGFQRESPPRTIHLSLRTALRIPAYFPMFLFPCYIIWILQMHFEIGWVLNILVLLVFLVLAYTVRKRLREVGLLRNGRMATGIVNGRDDSGDGPDEIFYYFVSSNGTPVQGRGWDFDYKIPVGSSVPVYYSDRNPENHIAATACWFEAD